jgi:hypothetical protein
MTCPRGFTEYDERCEACDHAALCPIVMNGEHHHGEPFYVYVVGPLSAPPFEYLAYVHRMSIASRECMDRGFVPINPAGDLLDAVVSGEAIDKTAGQARSMRLLELLVGKRAAVLVTAVTKDDGTPSCGTLAEIERACELGIPVVRSFDELLHLRGSEP